MRRPLAEAPALDAGVAVAPDGCEDRRTPRWIAALAVAVYLIYAANFLYFFVDDEAIPFVYAQNLLRGQGLSYNVLDGPLEGYSDFLHVWLSAPILGAVRAANLPKYWVFFIGKGVSLLAGTVVVLLTWAILRRLRVRRAGSVAALAFLALAGPFAVWSCSSLETVPFALAFLGLVWALISGHDRTAFVAASIMALDRIDGFVYAGAMLAAFIAIGPADRRRALLRTTVLPSLIVLAVYHGWRVWYFDDWLPSPLRAKILYKLTGGANLAVRAPRSPYWVRFLALYGWPAGVALLAAFLHAIRSGRAFRALALACAALFVYVAVVGDWMFGFRFFVTLVPVIGILIGSSVDRLAAWRPRIAGAATAAIVIWASVAAHTFIGEYRYWEHQDTFLRSRSLDLHRFFHPYYSLYEMARETIEPGDIVAYNQAGFLPFMLDLVNIDDLGICSRFYAQMPSTDVFFTEVGRYTPLTNKPAIQAGEAYLLYRDARYVLVRTDLLRRANHESVPGSLMGGYYELIGTDAEGANAIYRRTGVSAETYATDPGAFLENLAHTSYVRNAAVNGTAISPSDYGKRLAFLQEGSGEIEFTGASSLSLVFGRKDRPVREILVGDIVADVPAIIRLSLWSVDGKRVYSEIFELAAGNARQLWTEVPRDARASRFTLEVNTTEDTHGRIWIDDLRVQGQRLELERYLTHVLRFPGPAAASKNPG